MTPPSIELKAAAETHHQRMKPRLPRRLLLGVLLALTTSMVVRCPKASESFSWDQGGDDWYFYYEYNCELGDTISWLSHGGVNNSGFVSCPLAKMRTDTLTWNVFYPLFTLNGLGSVSNSVNLRQKNQVSVSVNLWPTNAPGPANLGGGKLRFFLAWFADLNDWAFYLFRREFVLPEVGGWVKTTLYLTEDLNDWELIGSNRRPPSELAQLLQNPQQWGFCITGANPTLLTNRLGFDQLELATPPAIIVEPPFHWERNASGWYYDLAQTGEFGESAPWFGHDGVDNSGFVFSPLDRLTAFSNAYVPLLTGSVRNPIDLSHPAHVSMFLNRAPWSCEPSATAELTGRLVLFVGEYQSSLTNGYYYYAKPFDPHAVSGWHQVGQDVQPDPAQWSLLCGNNPPPLTSLLKLPQQWGFALVPREGFPLTPPKGRLGFDNLEFPSALRITGFRVKEGQFSFDWQSLSPGPERLGNGGYTYQVLEWLPQSLPSFKPLAAFQSGGLTGQFSDTIGPKSRFYTVTAK